MQMPQGLDAQHSGEQFQIRVGPTLLGPGWLTTRENLEADRGARILSMRASSCGSTSNLQAVYDDSVGGGTEAIEADT
jgi:hypothetical protein